MTREEKYICLALGIIVYMKHKGVKLNNVFKEQDHPRDEVGRFTDGGGESGKKDYFTSSVENFGEKYEGIKGKEAINKLIKEKGGWCPDAFCRGDIGKIALFWGNDRVGLKHIIKGRTEKDNINIDEFLNDLTNIVEKGNIGIDKKGEAIVINYNNRRAIIDIIKDKENKIKFLLTAFELYDEKKE